MRILKALMRVTISAASFDLWMQPDASLNGRLARAIAFLGCGFALG